MRDRNPQAEFKKIDRCLDALLYRHTSNYANWLTERFGEDSPMVIGQRAQAEAYRKRLEKSHD